MNSINFGNFVGGLGTGAVSAYKTVNDAQYLQTLKAQQDMQNQQMKADMDAQDVINQKNSLIPTLGATVANPGYVAPPAGQSAIAPAAAPAPVLTAAQAPVQSALPTGAAAVAADSSSNTLLPEITVTAPAPAPTQTTALPSSQPAQAPLDTSKYTMPPNDPLATPANWGKSGQREDGSQKGSGYLGLLKRPDGGVSSEISVGVEINGKEMDVPTMVPTLTQAELDYLMTHPTDDPSKIPPSIIQKATDYAQARVDAGQSPFATDGGPSSTYVQKVVGKESGGNANATNALSSATGQGQFIDATWLDSMKSARPDLTAGKSDDQILAMRSDPALSQQMIGTYAQANAATLQKNGVPINDGSLYAAHMFGPDGAVGLYTADPKAPIESVVGKTAAANNNFSGQTVGDVQAALAKRMNVGTSAAPTALPTPAAAPQGPPAWYGKPVDADPPQTAQAQAQATGVPEGHHIVTQDEIDQARENNYIASGRPKLVEAGYKMRESRMTAQVQAQAVAEGNIKMAQQQSMQQIQHAWETAQSGNVQAALDQLTAAANHGVPNGSRLVIDKADGPQSDGKYIVTHTLNGKAFAKDAPQSIDEMFSKALAAASGSEAYANLLDKTTKAKEAQAQGDYYQAEAAKLNAIIRAGGPQADVERAKAEMRHLNSAADLEESQKQSAIQNARIAAEKDARKTKFLSIFNDDKQPMDARRNARTAYEAEDGKFPEVTYHGAPGGLQIKNDPLSEHPTQFYNENLKMYLPQGVDGDKVFKSPLFKDNSILPVWGANGKYGYKVKGQEADAAGNPQAADSWEEAERLYKAGPPRAGTAPAPMPSRSAIPARSQYANLPEVAQRAIAEQQAARQPQGIDPNWRRNVKGPDLSPITRFIQGPRNARNPGGYDPQLAALPVGRGQ